MRVCSLHIGGGKGSVSQTWGGDRVCLCVSLQRNCDGE